jgi:hypothetical protein
MAQFFEQKLNFSLFYQNSIGKGFSKNSKRKWFRSVESLNHDNMLKKIDFGPFAGRDSLWTTGEEVGFSKTHCKIQKQPNLDLSF